MKALASSTKTSIRTDEQGLLSLQFLMPLYDLSEMKNQFGARPKKQTGHVEFVVSPFSLELDCPHLCVAAQPTVFFLALMQICPLQEEDD